MPASSSLWSRLRIAGAGLRLGRGASRFNSTSASPPQATFTRQFVFRLIGLATWLPVAIWFNSTIVEITRIEGPSMYPFLNSRFNETLERDWVVNRKLYAQEGLQRGMIVFLRSPAHPEVVSVKRIIALEGDVVKTQQPFPTPYVRIPAGHMWIEGDAGPGKSLDSNTYGPVSIGLITGQLTHILLPFNKAGRVKWWEFPVEDRTSAVMP